MTSAAPRASVREFALHDAPLGYRVSGLTPGEYLWVTAQVTERPDRQWASHASFVADADGTVDVARDAPKVGSYEGVDAFGLLWSMTSSQVAGGLQEPWHVKVRLSARTRDREVPAVGTDRYGCDKGVELRYTHESGFGGSLWWRSDQPPAPAVILLGGSEGGAQHLAASLLASRGFCVLALSYFRDKLLPARPRRIPVEYFVRATEWLLGLPEVGSTRIGVVGGSLGATAALVLGCHSDSVAAVVAKTGSGVLYPRIGARRETHWTNNGVPLARFSVVPQLGRLLWTIARSGEATQRVTMEACVGGAAAVPELALPVERIGGPVLVIQGASDELIPRSFSRAPIDRRAARGGHPADELVTYPEAGHFDLVPGLPTVLHSYRLRGFKTELKPGGTRAGNARATIDSWNRTIRFLREHVQ
ncbi:MAG TPA: acyl-CoA thioesterase/bile acid-CoA:amino acid N-acyltransferase family protein [Actinomycetota bacterium]|nr:acyl-CoA thioesterase/bile acid-CoA:amino acid N-acyltransferase family protein [Actinomycetota bacterium]